ncbi:MAG: DCC1-like thiol-disulfide oxidoreductase family protein [Ignavibacteria bacterium]|nr:DCC1-like thiol-disulfide oxidoreductase family protein [Ignavibacteria bacterium]
MNKCKVILFDGVCNLCNSSVNFIIDHDNNKVFKFAALQSDIGQEMLSKFNLSKDEFDSVILIDNENCYTKSTAALKIAKEFSSYWKLLYVFIIIPAFIRNFFYDLISKNRYKMFGKKDSCRMPTPELKDRFL